MRPAAARREKVRRQRTEASQRSACAISRGSRCIAFCSFDSDIEEMLVRQGLLAPGLDYD